LKGDLMGLPLIDELPFTYSATPYEMKLLYDNSWTIKRIYY
jgi:hypothetical protein